jgi:diacylglycerol kinase family enzyme
MDAPSRMKILLLNNPNSGRGTNAAMAEGLSVCLREAGHTVDRLAAGRDLDECSLRDALRAAELLVVAGGDGTLHHSLPAIIETGIALYHFPLGTENLFTREFGMDRRPETLLRAIARKEIRLCDAGKCDGTIFSLMVSVGFDACVVERVAAGRRGGVTRGAYVRCALQEMMRPRVPRVRVVADGQCVVDGVEGMLVVANSKQYAARLNPAAGARMSDGKLDVVFFPHRTAIGLARWVVASAGGFAASVPGVVMATAERVEVELDRETPRQIDGEAAGVVKRMDVRVRTGVLRVLVP